MKRAALLAAVALLLIGAGLMYDSGPTHRFVVTLDEPARVARLTLGHPQGDVTTAMSGGPTEFIGESDIGDSAGAITVEWTDGTTTRCPIAYITSGEREPHRFAIASRTCPATGAGA